jgi:hypothetical protein
MGVLILSQHNVDNGEYPEALRAVDERSATMRQKACLFLKHIATSVADLLGAVGTDIIAASCLGG